MEYGKLEMWIDMFPIDGVKIPESVYIAPRKPLKYQLRIIVKNVDEVTLSDYNPITGERKSDIYVRAYLADEQFCEAQKTDVHYRSLNGEGNFNWRFVFDFEYLSGEEVLVYTEASIFSFRNETVKLKPICRLNFNNILRI